jgi:hypothetical protein
MRKGKGRGTSQVHERQSDDPILAKPGGHIVVDYHAQPRLSDSLFLLNHAWSVTLRRSGAFEKFDSGAGVNRSITSLDFCGALSLIHFTHF